MIVQTVCHYDFSKVIWNPENWRNEVIDPEFLLLFRAKPAELEAKLLTHYSGLSVYVAEFSSMTPEWSRRQNYSAFCKKEESGRILEASLKTEQESQPYRIGFPLSLIPEPEKEHEFVIMFDRVKLQFLCDGIVMDHEFPNGQPRHFYANDLRFIKETKAFDRYFLSNDLSGIIRTERKVRTERPIQYYTPFGSNTWLGDAVVHEYKGVFHVFYLFDRHHHGSRNGKGLHEFWHLTTEDFINWTDHGPVFEISEPWQAVGTGNAFIFQDKLHLSFGWHTERAVPTCRTVNYLFLRNLQLYGHTGKFRYNEIGELLPAGASYVTSEDGVHFTPSNLLIHHNVNPCIFVQDDGSLHLVQRGIWKSDHLGDWVLIDRDFPPYLENSFARNNLDCPAMFELDGWEYCMVGFSAFFGREKGRKEWIDFTEQGRDPYDGTNVPMVARDQQNRLIEGGWLGGIGWGSCLLLREIIALGNGRIGKRWIPETLPEFDSGHAFAEWAEVGGKENVLLEFTVDPQNGEFSVLFEGEGTPCEFRLNPVECKVQWALAGERVPTFREEMNAHPEYSHFDQSVYAPKYGRDYAKEELTGLENRFTVRILIHADPKMNAVILDAEIAGCHTMATMRNNLSVSAVSTNNKENLLRFERRK